MLVPKTALAAVLIQAVISQITADRVGNNVLPLEFPCPLDVEFLPCKCTADTVNTLLEADCSAAKTDEDLQSAFTVAQFPFPTFDKLTIDQTGCSDCDLTLLDQLTFGPVSFVTIEIKGTNIETVGSGAFQNSENTLVTLNLPSNKINSFAFEVLGQFTELITLNLHGNQFDVDSPIPELSSGSLKTLNLGLNPKLVFTEWLVADCPELTTLVLPRSDIQAIPMQELDVAGIFAGLEKIRTVDFSGNRISLLGRQSLVPEKTSLGAVNLANNAVAELHAGFISGFSASGSLDMSNNNLTTMPEDIWRHVIEELQTATSGTEAVFLNGNKLLCGCDMAWLVLDTTGLMDVVAKGASCNGDGVTFIHDLPPDFFDFCVQELQLPDQL